MSHVDLPDDAVRLAEAQVAAGRARCDEKVAKLRAAIDEGDESPDFEGDPFAAVRAEFGLKSR